MVAVDPAGGGSEGDYSAAQVLDLETGLQCAEFAGHVGGLELARLVTELARSTTGHGWWWRGTIMAAECWRWRRRFAGIERIYGQGGQPGWLTTSMSRPAVLGRLGAALVEAPERFQSRRLLAECRSFVRLAEWQNGSAGGNARRPGDGHGDRAGGAGGVAGEQR